jgi:hypothetical protein
MVNVDGAADKEGAFFAARLGRSRRGTRQMAAQFGNHTGEAIKVYRASYVILQASIACYGVWS